MTTTTPKKAQLHLELTPNEICAVLAALSLANTKQGVPPALVADAETALERFLAALEVE